MKYIIAIFKTIDYFIKVAIANVLDFFISILCKMADYIDPRQFELNFEMDDDEELPEGFEWTDEEDKKEKK